MNIKDIMPKFPPSCYINGQILLVNPNEFHRLQGIEIDCSRVFVLVCEGYINASINRKRHILDKNYCIDGLDTVILNIKECSEDAKAWCMLVTYSFASNSLKNLRPVPVDKLLQTHSMPIYNLSETSTKRLDIQLKLLADAIAAKEHFYQNELASIFYKSLCLELGNAIISDEKITNNIQLAYKHNDTIAMNFARLISKYFAKQHNIDFYAETLNISAKHLTRIIKEKMGRTPHTLICDEITHEAMACLEDGNLPIGTISEKLCFSDQAAFCKFFKRQVGISPTEYRTKKNMSYLKQIR